MLWMWDAFFGGLETQPWPYNITQAWPYPKFPDIHPQLHKSIKVYVRVDTYAHTQHTKMLKHFVYICYGCGMNFTWVWSLSHDLTASLRLAHTPIILKSPTPAQKHNSVRVRGDPYAHPQHSKVLKHFVYICYECGMHYNITRSQPYTPSIIYPKYPDNSGWKIGQLCLSTA